MRDDLTAFIPARGGSKGITGKNLRLVGGTPLVSRAVAAAATVAHRVVVSTDDPQIAAAARLTGADVIDRPAHLATDTATVDEVVIDYITANPGPLLVLQPTVMIDADDLWAWIESMPFTESCVVYTAEHRHLVWHDGAPLTMRAQRQDRAFWPENEIGVRYYPEDWNGTYLPHEGPAAIDIDTPADLTAARMDTETLDIAFWTTGNREIGHGHYQRCLALAGELPGHRPHFVFDIATDLPGCPYPVLTETESRLIADVIVVDRLDTMRFATDQPRVHLEDLGPGGKGADALINTLYEPEHLRYAVIRPEFFAVPDYRPSGDGRVFVTFGGTDPGGFSEAFIDSDMMLMKPPGRDLAGDPSNLWGLTVAEGIAWADLVITSGGRTVLEAMASRTPVVSICQNAREMTHAHLGWQNGVAHAGLGYLGGLSRGVEMADYLRSAPNRLMEMSEMMRGKVDGHGTERLARLIEDVGREGRR